jgi:hypothetical protein
MAEIKEFVVNDRRKFTSEGELRPDAPPSEAKPPRPETLLEPTSDETLGSSAHLVENLAPTARTAEEAPLRETQPEEMQPLPAPTSEQSEQATRAYDATVDRLDTAIRATNPGMEHPPEMTFERVIQSLYMQALLQLGGAAEPGQPPQVDLLGARQTIDMLDILAKKTTGNLSDSESKLVDTALFELRMGFLEVTQALARQAQTKQTGAPPVPGTSGGPQIVR